MSFLEHLRGAVVMAPMTKGSNLPYRRLCVELGAKVTVSEMTVARRLKQKRNSEFALIRRFEGEPCFGVQLCGNQPDETAWAASLVESRGADFVDINFGCPIEHFTRKGLGAALGRHPNRMRRLVEAVKGAVHVPVTAKIRLGWNDNERNYRDQVRAVVDGGADALFVHGRTRNARYRSAADWDIIGEITSAVSIPVIGNGDLLFPDEIAQARQRAGCDAVMVARAALIKPWIFQEAHAGYGDITPEERLQVYRRYVQLAREHWGEDEYGLTRIRGFVKWHLDFWCRYAPRREDGTYPSMQHREGTRESRSALDALLARSDEQAFDYLAEALTMERQVDPTAVPPPALKETEDANARQQATALVEVEG